ncbi:MAG: hypothetical protein HYS86_01765 [Candidatus Chisholmbacteria bacterium]|nr:hypothetical protein [Candidatus Chisholmbacteria bacterium]
MYEETLELVHTTRDLALLRGEIGELGQSLYRISTRGTESTRSTKGTENTESREGTEGGFEEVLENSVRAVVAEAIRADLESTGRTSSASRAGREGREGIGGSSYSQSGIERFLDGLEKRLASLKVVRLTIAFEPTRETIGRMVDQISDIKYKKSYRQNLEDRGRRRIVLELTVDPRILGGVQMATAEGRFYDLSVAGKIDRVLEESREEILGRLRRNTSRTSSASRTGSASSY